MIRVTPERSRQKCQTVQTHAPSNPKPWALGPGGEMERVEGGNPRPRPRHHITDRQKPRASRPISPTLSSRRHPGPPLVPTVISSPSVTCRCAALRRGGVSNADAGREIIYHRPHTPHLSAILLARPVPLSTPPLGISASASAPPGASLRLLLCSLRPAAARIQPPRVAFSAPPPFFPEVPARPLLFIPPALRQRRSLPLSRPSGARQIRARHSDPRHRR